MTSFTLTTPRLLIRPATVEDAGLYLRLWTDPRVMAQVGFPRGIPISREEIQDQILTCGSSEFEQLLVVERQNLHQPIGECRIHFPNAEKIATTDVKLLPKFWGQKYGVEIKQALLEHIFSHTDCQAVDATPNVNNIASIRMQEAVGGIRIGEQVYTFPESMQGYTIPVHHYIYRVYRADWLQRRHPQGNDFHDPKSRL